MGAKESTGFDILDGIRDSSEFLNIARQIGDPISLNDGTFVKNLNVVSSDLAKPNTLSARFGTGTFPFHTDTAFWHLPARWVLLRGVSGDLTRPTHLMPFEKLFDGLKRSLIRRSAWICDTGVAQRYSTAFFLSKSIEGFRYDPCCMRPANDAAREVDRVVRPRCFDLPEQRIEWIPDRVVIINNWSWLHARGETASVEQERILQRIYVK